MGAASELGEGRGGGPLGVRRERASRREELASPGSLWKSDTRETTLGGHALIRVVFNGKNRNQMGVRE